MTDSEVFFPLWLDAAAAARLRAMAAEVGEDAPDTAARLLAALLADDEAAEDGAAEAGA